jgi:hypothetical protein
VNETLYQRYAQAVFSVFEKLREELAAEADDSPVLARLHELATKPEKEFFAELQRLADFGPEASKLEGELLTRCMPVGGVSSSPVL